MEYQIISDSSCDLEVDLREKYQIEVVPFMISFDDNTYYKEREEIGIREVYDHMVEKPKEYPKTSLPSVRNFVDAFVPHVKEGRAIICITLTTSLSGSYNSACNAKEIVCEEYPEAEITVLNSQSATVSQGLYVIRAAKLKQQGKSYQEVVAYLQDTALLHSSHIFFTVGNTDYLQHGGRIGKVASVASSALNLKPLITLEDGSIDASGIARSRKKSMKKVLELVQDYFKKNGENPADYDYSIGFGYDKEEAELFMKEFQAMMQGIPGIEETYLVQIGATICVHTGPYAIGIGILKK